MPPVLDTLAPFSFSAISFPYVTYKVSGGLRDKVHEYPHSPGGAAEKLGRRLYEVSVQAEFASNAIVPKYQGLWPDALSALRTLFEAQTTADLHVPTIGTFKAYATTWGEEVRNTKRSSVLVDLTFREDQNQAFLVNKLVEIDRASLKTQIENFSVSLEDKDYSTDLFDGIVQSANALLSIKDQIDLYGGLVASKIETLALLCDQADRQVNELDTLEFQNVRDALHDLWLSATQLEKDSRTKLAALKTFTTPMRMTINAVARAVGVENPADVMQLNAIVDPLAIPAGMALRYYEPT